MKIPDNDLGYVFFVTFGQIIGDHTFDEWITEDGFLSWQSQPRQKLLSPVIQQLIRLNHPADAIHLFLRTQKRDLYRYYGRLSYEKHDPRKERPVYFLWRLLDWNRQLVQETEIAPFIVPSSYAVAWPQTDQTQQIASPESVLKTETPISDPKGAAAQDPPVVTPGVCTREQADDPPASNNTDPLAPSIVAQSDWDIQRSRRGPQNISASDVDPTQSFAPTSHTQKVRSTLGESVHEYGTAEPGATAPRIQSEIHEEWRSSFLRPLSFEALRIDGGIRSDLTNAGIRNLSELIAALDAELIDDWTLTSKGLSRLLALMAARPAYDPAVIDQQFADICAAYAHRPLSNACRELGCSVQDCHALSRRARGASTGGRNLTGSEIVIPPVSTWPLTDRTIASKGVSQVLQQSLSERDFELVRLRWGDRLTLDETGKTLAENGHEEITRERVRQLEVKAKKLLVLSKVVVPAHLAGAAVILAFFDRGGSATLEEIAGDLGISAKDLGLTFHVIDNLAEIGAFSGFVGPSVHYSNWPVQSPKRGKDLFTLFENLPEIELALDEIIGPACVMRTERLMARLDNMHLLRLESQDASLESKAAALAGLGAFKVVEPHSYEGTKYGSWVVRGLTTRQTEIASAIIRSSSKLAFAAGARSRADFDFRPQGVPSHEIISELDALTGNPGTEHALNALAARLPRVFIQTARAAWGLPALFGEPYEPVEESDHEHGATTDALEIVMTEAEGPLKLNEIVQRVRQQLPDALELTIRLYLVTHHTDRYDAHDDGTFTINKGYLGRKASPLIHGETIETLMNVMNDADRPLSIEEIVRRCSLIKPVSHVAIRGYLLQNYGGRFDRLSDGTYGLA